MRTQDQIVARMQADDPLFGWARDVLIEFLDYEHARPFLKEDTTPEQWAEVLDEAFRQIHGFGSTHHPAILGLESAQKALATYMRFAWSKVEDHRGLSAGRSVDKCTAYAWLLGDDACVAAVEAAPYPQYGAPKLAVICRAFNLPIPDEIWAHNMIAGERCGADYECGCGR
jgi:hypothetical protein